MELTLVSKIVLMYFDTFISHSILYLYMSAISGSRMQWKKIFMMILTMSAITTAMTISRQTLLPELPVALFNIYGVLLINALGVYLVFERDICKSVILVSLSAMLQVGTAVATLSYIDSGDTNTYLLQYLIGMVLLYPCLAWIIRTVLIRLHIGSNLQHLIEKTEHPWKVALLVVLLENLCETFYFFKDILEENFSFTYSMTMLLLLGVIFAVLVYFSVKGKQDAKIKIQEAVMMQQKIYIDSLESMQQEMRAFRHDYKNMLSGMYLQAKEGELLAIQDSIQKMTVNFDERVGENIRQTTQLGNIRVLEFKSLILTKLMEMNEKQIKCDLEVLYPVEKLGMEILDLNRCVGILLDNAIEAVEGMEEPVIGLVISSQEKGLTILVRNRVEGKMEFHRIWENGYSTKGRGRGLGLASYQKIIEKYSNVTPVTNYQNGEFVQELKIAVRR